MARLASVTALVSTLRCGGVLCLLGAPLAALDQLNLILPNARNLPMGDTGSLEGNAVVARTTGASAAWYNPAGLSGMDKREVTASASVFDYQRTAIESPYSSDERRTLTIVPGFAGASQTIEPLAGDPNDQWGFGLIVATPVQWATSVSQEEQVRTATGVLGYGESYSSSYEVYQPTLAIGRDYGDHQRIGISGSLMINQLSLQRSVTELDTAAQTAASSSTQIHGSCFMISLAAGYQWWEPTSGWAFGASLTLPGIRVYSTGDRTDTVVITDNLSGTSTIAGGSDSDYPLELNAPASTTFGFARTRDNWSVELDITLDLPSAEREILPSTSISGVTAGPGNTLPDIKVPIPAVDNTWRLTLNGALGGAYRLSDTWWAHAGLLSDRTTVDESGLFVPVDLWSVTTGVSVRGENTLFTVGLGYTWTTDGTAESEDLATGDVTESDLNIRILRVIVGTSYHF